MSGHIRRPGVREGYDLWASTYDTTKNPLVALDRRRTFGVLSPKKGELILDAGCGTGYYMSKILEAGARCIGSDLSRGMLMQARTALPGTSLVQSDLDSFFPFRTESFDAVLSALVSEHISDIGHFCNEVARVLRRRGRFVWSVFHPQLAHGGAEANFTDIDGNEVRLGAELHSLAAYRDAIRASGLDLVQDDEFSGDEALARSIDRATKYIGKPMLIIYAAVKP